MREDDVMMLTEARSVGGSMAELLEIEAQHV